MKMHLGGQPRPAIVRALTGHMLRTALPAAVAWATFSVAHAAPLPCSSLAALHLPDTTITVAEDIAGGTFITPAGAPIADLPAFCRVAATSRPSADSNINIEVWLPSTGWNGRFLGTGGGGYAGSIGYTALATVFETATR